MKKKIIIKKKQNVMCKKEFKESEGTASLEKIREHKKEILLMILLCQLGLL
jgi:hypothetical protein